VTNRFGVLLAGFSLVLLSSPVLADELEGRIESIKKSNQSFVVQGTEFFVTPSTKFEDGLKGFDDLKQGLKVEVEFQSRDGKHYGATTK
jgi:hypothetical protein